MIISLYASYVKVNIGVTESERGIGTIIRVPFKFEFRTTKVQWVQSSARIKGWWRRSDGSVDGENLIAEITKGGSAKSIQFPLERLRDKEWEQCVATIGDDGVVKRICDQDVERICAAFDPQLLLRSDRTYNIRHTEPTTRSEPENAWYMREEFLRFKSDCENALVFLNKWGSWDFGEYVFLSDMIRLQQVAREALTSPPDRWFATDYSVPPMWHRRLKYPYFAMVTDKCEIAVRMTVTVDLMRRLKFKICARPDCGQPFAVTSKHKKKFCSRNCGHLELVRRNRKQRERTG